MCDIESVYFFGSCFWLTRGVDLRSSIAIVNEGGALSHDSVVQNLQASAVAIVVAT